MSGGVERHEEAGSVRPNREVSDVAAEEMSDLPGDGGGDAMDAGWLSAATADPAFFIKGCGLD